jgi:hypothetical protein
MLKRVPCVSLNKDAALNVDAALSLSLSLPRHARHDIPQPVRAEVTIDPFHHLLRRPGRARDLGEGMPGLNGP